MSLFVNTTYRSDRVELMDDLSMEGELLQDTLNKIATINKWLGGNSVTLNGLKHLLSTVEKDKVLTIIDLGCGNGDMLCEIARYGRKNDRKFKLVGVDANEFTVNYARQLSKEYEEITYEQIDVFSKDFEELEYDIALATLFIHHFKEKEIIHILKLMNDTAKVGVIINDLQRHKLAYYLFKIVSSFLGNEMVQHDGLLSILRGFKRKELEVIANKLNRKNTIRWKWAFRYQWIFKN